MTEADDKMACLIRHTAEKLWDISETILSSGQASADDWEIARLTAGILLAELQRSPEQGDHQQLYNRGKPPQSVV